MTVAIPDRRKPALQNPGPINRRGGNLPRGNRNTGSEDRALRSVIGDLYAVIDTLDSARRYDFAGRLHALTLELRERLSAEETPPLS